MRFAFIEAEKALYPVLVLCRVMQVGRSGFYAWLRRAPSARTQADAVLQGQIDRAFLGSRGTYGSPRIRAQLNAEGVQVSKRRVARLMRRRGLCGLRKARFTRTTDSRHKLPIAPNLLARNFTATAPNAVWVTDVTFIWTLQGWLYLAAILDLYSRRVVGWAMSAHNDQALVLQALNMALCRRQPPQGLIHHSDRGSVYCGTAYLAMLKAHGIKPSMSRKGDCWDNAVAESFFGTLKQELLFRRQLEPRRTAQTAIFEFLEAYYNRKRRHSTLGFLSPVDFEERTDPADPSM